MEMLNYKSLSERFPICNNGVSSDQAWSLLLRRWRTDGKIKERFHWRYGPSVEVTNKPTRYYDLLKVVKLVCIEARADSPRPRVSFLYQSYFDEFAAILKEANSATAATAEQVITT